MRLRKPYKRGHLKLKLKKNTVQSLVGLFLLLLAGISLISLFGVSDPVVRLREFIYYFLGWGNVLLPVVFLLSGLLLLNFSLPFVSSNSAAGSAALLVSLISLSAFISDDSSGVVGRTVSDVLSSLLSIFGAIFVLLIASIVSIIIMFNTSLEGLIAFIQQVNKVFVAVIKQVFSREEKKEGSKKEEPVFTTRGISEDSGAEEKADKEIGPVTSSISGPNEVWEYPPLSILSDFLGSKANRGDVKQNAGIIERTLDNFGIQARVVEVNMGPAVTQYALEIALGTKLTKITALSNDIALALSSPNGMVRIEAPIPGKSLVGIEVPNIAPETVPLKSILTSSQMQKSESKLSLTLGLDVSGSPIIDDLGRMPHMLVAGSTGSGKSVAINSFITTLLFRSTPEEVKFILVDPKLVELSQWAGIPHLLTPVITEPEKVLSALKWAISEMDRRYKLFKEVGVRNINLYNEAAGFQTMPYIVIIIDEFAHLMHFAPVEVEDAVTKLAQMSRATGIHMILATQRPSVDVITGLIKANVPCRLAFNVTSRVDSQVIIDQPGAEKLLGRGDMLYVPPDASKPQRIQGVFVSEPEIKKLIDFLTKSGVEPQYTEEVISMPVGRVSGKTENQDELFDEAVRVVCQYDRASASLLQRRLRVGYARAARLLDELETAGVVGVQDGSKARDVLVKDPARVLGGAEEEN